MFVSFSSQPSSRQPRGGPGAAGQSDPMTYLAVLIILIGGYLIDSGVKNRAPIGFIQALIRDPSNVRKTLDQYNGRWTVPPGLAVEGNAERGTGGRVEKGLGSSSDPRNGRLSRNELKSVPWSPSKRLAPSAVDALARLNTAYRNEFGSNLFITDAYRTYAQQVALKAVKPNLAAVPGTSNHGLGLAVDLGGGINRFGTKEHQWMAANAPAYGWVNPSWARQGGSKPEPWHWEFVGNAVAA